MADIPRKEYGTAVKLNSITVTDEKTEKWATTAWYSEATKTFWSENHQNDTSSTIRFCFYSL